MARAKYWNAGSGLVLAVIGLAMAAPAAAQQPPEAVAAEALRRAPVWDGHNDVPGQLRGRHGNVLAEFDFRDTTASGATHPQGRVMQTDLTRLRQGRVGAQFWSVYVPATLPEPQAVQQTIEQIDVTRRLIDRYPADLALALTSEDVARAMRAGRIASLIGMEGGHSIGSSLAVLRQMYALGARYMTLTHTKNTPWADSGTDAPKNGGLNDFGRDAIREMNRLGMLVDLSHVSEETMADVLDITRAPVMFSHSGARAVNNHARNVPDNILARMKDNGGIVMVVAFPSYTSEELRQWTANRAGEEARLNSLWQGQPARVTELMAAWTAANPAPLATVAQLADHVDHVRRIAGIDHIGIGGDYDGMPTGPVTMEDVSGYPRLFEELARRGYSRADLEKIASGNMMRVMRGAEAAARAMAGTPPFENRVAASD